MKKLIFIVLILITFISVFSFGCARNDLTKIQTGNSIYTVGYLDLDSEVNLSGSVSFDSETYVYPKVSGIVNKIYVEEGSLVRAGDKILEIDSTQAKISFDNASASYESNKISYELTLKSKKDLENSVIQAENNLELANASYEVAKESYNQVKQNPNATELQKKQAEQQLIQAETSVSNAKIALENANRQLDNFSLKLKQAQIQLDLALKQLNQAKENLNNYIVTSPITGVVLSLNAKENSLVQPGMQIALIGNPKALIVTSYADEIDVPKLKVGQSVNVTFDTINNLTLTGNISFIGFTKVNIQGGSAYIVKVKIDKDNPQIRNGMSANVSIIVASKKHVLAIPISSITTLSDGRTFVDKVVNNKIERVEVKIGLYGNAYAEVLSGLNEGDKILLVPEQNTYNTTFNVGG